MEGAPDKPPRRRRLFKAAVIFLLLLLLMTGGIAAFWATGIPFRWAVERMALSEYGAAVRIEGASGLSPIRAERITIVDAAAPESARPLLVARDVAIYPIVFPANGRWVRKLSAAVLELHIDVSDPEHPNYAFLIPEDDAPRGEPTFLPQSIAVADAALHVVLPDGESWLAGVAMGGAVANTDAFELTIEGNRVDGRWSFPELEEAGRVTEGFLRAKLARATADWDGHVLAGVPGFAEVDGAFQAVQRDDAVDISVQAPTLRLYGGYFAPLLSRIADVPLDFALLNASGSTLNAEVSDQPESFPQAVVHADIKQLVVGDPETAWYTGDLRAEGAVSGGPGGGGALEIVLANGKQVQVGFEGTPAEFGLSAALSGWTREDVLAITPAAIRASVEAVEFTGLDGTLAYTRDGPAYTANAQLESRGPAGDQPIRLTLDARGDTADGPFMVGALDARFGKGRIEATADAPEADAFTGKVILTEVDVVTWGALFAQVSLPEDLSATAHGAVSVAKAADSTSYRITPEIRLRPLVYGDWTFEHVPIESGVWTYDAEAARVQMGQLSFTLDEHTVTISETTISLEPLNAAARLAADLDVTSLAEAAELEGWYGTATAAGDVRLTEGNLTGTLSVESTDLAFGDWVVPYGSTLSASGTLAYATESQTGAFDQVLVRLGDDARIEMPRIAFATEPMTASGAFRLESTWQPGVDMLWLKEAEGTITGAGEFRYADEDLRADWNFNAQAVRILLNEDLATITGVTAQGSGVYANEALQGEGALTARAVLVAGATASSLSGPVRIEDEVIVLPETVGQLFDGELKIGATLAWLQDDQPVALDAQLTNFDLARLTAEVEPPKVRLTGIADAAGSLTYSEAGLQAFLLDGISTQGFSLNRSMVEDVLASGDFQESLGSRRVIDRTMDKLLGEQPQRPFDSARIHLELAEQRIRGQAELLSEKTPQYNGLNLTVDMAIDPPALAEALSLLQQGGDARVDVQSDTP